MASKKSEYRFERGASERHFPTTPLWGAKTELLRGLSAFAGDIRNQVLDNFLLVKKIAAHTNAETGSLEPAIARTIGQCCDEILQGQWRDQFFLNTILLDGQDLLQENINEVITSRCAIIMGGHGGQSGFVCSDTDLQINEPKSEAFQITLRITLLTNLRNLQNSLLDLERLLRRKSLEFDRVDSLRDLKKSDPAKLTRGKFNMLGGKIERCVKRVNDVFQGLLELPSSPSKSGTESGEQSRYRDLFIEKLKLATNLNFRLSDWPETDSLSAFVELSSALKELALELRNTGNELRHEICGQRQTDKLAGQPLPPIESSERDHALIPLDNLLLVALDILGRDMTVSLCAQETAGNGRKTMPLIAESLLSSVDALCKALPVFNTRTVATLQPGKFNQPDLIPAHIAHAAHHI